MSKFVLVFLCAFSIVLFFSFIYCKMKDKRLSVTTFVCMLSFTFIWLNSISNISNEERTVDKRTSYAMWEIIEKAESYDIFIDGIKVDNDKIEITNYESKNIAVNDDKKEIYIASRSKR